MTAAEEFTEFAAGAAPQLRRTAFLLCGNWHTAEDLAQTTLAKMFVSWRRITRQDAVYAYANRTLVNTYLADRRGKRARELLAGWLPERPVELPTPELRIVVLDALATLPPKARVVVVMRYWADLRVDQVADLLGCSPGNVKSQSARGLDKLRVVLGESGLVEHPADRLLERPTDKCRETGGARKTGFGIAITPDGKTVFVANVNGTVTPISTATNPAGTPIKVCADAVEIAVTPDGKAAYVMCSSSVTPIATATGKAGAPIKVPPTPWTLVIVADPAHS